MIAVEAFQQFDSVAPTPRLYMPRFCPRRPHTSRHRLRRYSIDNVQRPVHACITSNTILSALKSVRPKLRRPAWAMTEAQAEQASKNGQESEAEVTALLTFFDNLNVDEDEDMNIAHVQRSDGASSSVYTSPIPKPLYEATNPNETPTSPTREDRQRNEEFDRDALGKSEAFEPAVARLPPEPGNTRDTPHQGPVHSQKSALMLFQRHSVQAASGNEEGMRTESKGSPLSLSLSSSQSRQSSECNLFRQDRPKVASDILKVKVSPKEGGGDEECGGGRPLPIPRVVVIDEEGGLRRRRLSAHLPYWHENPAL